MDRRASEGMTIKGLQSAAVTEKNWGSRDQNGSGVSRDREGLLALLIDEQRPAGFWEP
jgi:hypothetical protein